uniref:Guanine nucleotidebinding protein subunit gamma1like [Acyrthosiphon pisum] n=1 Tax=Lepeophtheirus salmonis TaxID=72036 RepID=A0A0K2TB69_LEPSM
MVSQLRKEASLKRIPASEAIQDIKKYILLKESEDCLVVGFADPKYNPFKEISSCHIV